MFDDRNWKNCPGRGGFANQKEPATDILTMQIDEVLQKKAR
jgi:hypothetical protein